MTVPQAKLMIAQGHVCALRCHVVMLHPRRSAPQHSVWLGMWPLHLLLLEYLALSMHFDAKPLRSAAGDARGFGYLGILAPALIVMATVTYALSGPGLRAALQNTLRETPMFGLTRRVALLANVLCYVALWLQASRVLSQTVAGSAPSLGTLSLFLITAAASAAALLAALVPADALRPLAPAALQAGGLGAVAGALAWSAGVASEQLWQHLQATTLHLVLALMLPFSNEIVFAPEDAVIGTAAFIVQVAPECSGLEGIGLICVVMAVYLLSARERLRFPKALLLLPVAVALVFLGNALRIALLIAVGAHGAPEIALSGFHSKAGWLFFCAIALSLIACVQRFAWFARDPGVSSPAATETWNPAATYLLPMLTLIATSLVTALFTVDGFDRFYGLRLLTTGITLYTQRKHLPPLWWPASWHAPLTGLVVFGLWCALAPQPPEQQVLALRAQVAALGPPGAWCWLVLRALGAALVVPIAEELAFRGFLLRRMISADFSAVDRSRITPLALLGSTVAFALLHPHAWLAAVLAGLAYAWAQKARGRMADAVVAHAITNACIALAVLTHDAYWLWV